MRIGISMKHCYGNVFNGLQISGSMDTAIEMEDSFDTSFHDTVIDVSNHAPSRAGRKYPRNRPCPCGSNKKYKRCCGV